jgi:hypothetical protein
MFCTIMWNFVKLPDESCLNEQKLTKFSKYLTNFLSHFSKI